MVEMPSEGELLACCASQRWVGEVAAHQPYSDLESLCQISDAVIKALPWPEVLAAVSAHPRIGERAGGESREARWSRSEQATAATDLRRTSRLQEANAEYERRFGHVFLICATGLSADEVLAALQQRLTNDPTAEQQTVREELQMIARLRLAKLVAA